MGREQPAGVDPNSTLAARVWGVNYSVLTSPDLAWDEHFRFARAAAAHAIQHLGNEASLPSLAQINGTHARFDERREELDLMLAE